MESPGSEEESKGIFNANLIDQFKSLLSIPSPIDRYTNQEHALQGSGDIFEEILTCLPVKSAFRFKCLSKWCYQVISDPSFVNKIRIRRRSSSSSSRRNDTLLGFFHILGNSNWSFMSIPSFETEIERKEEEEEEKKESVKSMQSLFPTRINGQCICSCDGLFLLRRPSSDQDRHCYCVFNPLTREYYQLPPSPSQGQQQRRLPSFFQPCMGLIVNTAAGAATYRVICAVVMPSPSNNNNNNIEIETFSSETGLWEVTTMAVTIDLYHRFVTLNLPERKHKTAVIRGAIYWIPNCFRHPGDTCMGGGSIIVYHPPSLLLQCVDNRGAGAGDDDNAGRIELIEAPPCQEYFDGVHESYLDIIGESYDGLLQMAALHLNVNLEVPPLIRVWVLDSNRSDWFVRDAFGVPIPTLYKTPYFVPAANFRYPCITLLAFYPHNPQLQVVLINVMGGIFVYQRRSSTVSLMNSPFQGLNPNFSLQPCSLQIWPISALPLPLLLQRNIQRRPNYIQQYLPTDDH